MGFVDKVGVGSMFQEEYNWAESFGQPARG